MARRNLGRAPLDVPVMHAETETDHSWERFFAQVAEYVNKWDKYDVVINPTSVAANSTSEQTFTVNGVATNDFVTVSKPSHTSGLGISNIRVSNTNQVAITFINTTAGAIDPPSETYTFKVEKI